jgi:N6-adenosine-specific RNA methylase IME4
VALEAGIQEPHLETSNRTVIVETTFWFVTYSSAMNNDLNTHFVVSGELPTNFVVDSDIDRFPKIKKLRELKTKHINENRLHEPLYINADLRTLPLRETLGTEFETILVDPPWYEYYARAGGFPPACDHGESTEPWWTYEEIRDLRIEDIAATPGFCFLWCANKHVEQATACLLKWGYRRIEDICWLKTNAESIGLPDYLPFGALNALKTSKEHLLVGIRGTVHRSRDSHLIHANVDSDVIIAPQEPAIGCTRKPSEAYDIIERFCNGQRRLELFGNTLRAGWVTIGSSLPEQGCNYDARAYEKLTSGENRFIKPCNEIEKLRPKSPRRSIGTI